MRLPLCFLTMALAAPSLAFAQTNANPLGELNGTPEAPPATTAPAPSPAAAPAPARAGAAPAGTAAAPGLPAAGPQAAAPQPEQPSPNDVALQEAAQMVRDNELDPALAKLNAVLQEDPRNVNAYVLRGQVYSEKKMLDKEENDFQSAHLLDPTNPIVNFDVAEAKFTQKSYDAARIGFADLAKDHSTLIGDLAAYKVFLCDLLGDHPDLASKEFDNFNQAETGASYYYANAAWDLVHHKTEEARGWLASASQIYNAQKNTLYAKSLQDLGYLPLPAPPASQ